MEKKEPMAATVKGLLNRTLLELSLNEDDVLADEIRNGAQEAAIELITMAGFDGQDSDHFGVEMGDVVQTLLQIVMIRCPQLANRITGTDADGQIVWVEG